MRVAVLVKQVPSFEGMVLGPEGRLAREGLTSEMNPYCRRAVSKGVELAKQAGGRCTVFTLGPPAAEDVLREAVAWGADDAVLLTDPAFAGSDTWATARALAAALVLTGPFDLYLVGRNSVDADTGQVGPETAEMLGLPFLGGVRVLSLDGATVRARCEYDDGWSESEVTLPAFLSTAERLCDPAKVAPAGRAAVAQERIRTLSAADLGDGPWGQAGSLTDVGAVRLVEAGRDQRTLSGPLEAQVEQAVALLVARGAVGEAEAPSLTIAPVADHWSRGERVVGVVLEEGRARGARELLGAAADLASAIGGRVVALSPADPQLDATALSTWGADEVVVLDGSSVECDVAPVIAEWSLRHKPWALLAPGTMWGREVAARTAVRLGAGLTGDAVEFSVADDRLVSWKPAFGGALVAAVIARSPIQMATVRPGMLALKHPRPPREVPGHVVRVLETGRVRRLGSGRDDELDVLAAAPVVIGVGRGVAPEDYPQLVELQSALGAELGATRKVTDEGWMPRARQIGITGRSIAPRLYVALGASGKFNHSVGVRGAKTVLAVNTDPNAVVFDHADVGIVGDWRQVVPLIVEELIGG